MMYNTDLNKARLEFGENFIEIANLKHFSEDKVGGSQYNTLYELRVRSSDGKFTGVGDGEDDIENIRKLADELQQMYELKLDEVNYRDAFGFVMLEFFLSKKGHITISGLVDKFGDTLEFRFEADQTALLPFINELNKILEEAA